MSAKGQEILKQYTSLLGVSLPQEQEPEEKIEELELSHDSNQ
jgi:hypothetical protein